MREPNASLQQFAEFVLTSTVRGPDSANPAYSAEDDPEHRPFPP